jgi:hypothetical protein
MKLHTAAFAFFLLPSFALADFKLPAKVFSLEELDKAKAEAASKKKPIAILLSDKDSTCPLCSNASQTMIKELGQKTVMVYVRDYKGLPPAAVEALTPGKYIPKVAVLDEKLEASLGMVTYESVKEDSRTAFRDVEKAIREYKK